MQGVSYLDVLRGFAAPQVLLQHITAFAMEAFENLLAQRLVRLVDQAVAAASRTMKILGRRVPSLPGLMTHVQ